MGVASPSVIMHVHYVPSAVTGRRCRDGVGMGTQPKEVPSGGDFCRPQKKAWHGKRGGAGQGTEGRDGPQECGP